MTAKIGEIPFCILQEIKEFFPVNGVHWQTRKSNESLRVFCASFVAKALRSRGRAFRCNTKILNKIVGSRCRKLVVKFFSESKFIGVSKKHSAGNHSISRQVSPCEGDTFVDVFEPFDGWYQSIKDRFIASSMALYGEVVCADYFDKCTEPAP
jgi:hypothetical protein